MLLATVHCCINCRNSDAWSKLALALLHFMQDFSISRFYRALILHLLHDFSPMLRAAEHGARNYVRFFAYIGPTPPLNKF